MQLALLVGSVGQIDLILSKYSQEISHLRNPLLFIDRLDSGVSLYYFIVEPKLNQLSSSRQLRAWHVATGSQGRKDFFANGNRALNL